MKYLIIILALIVYQNFFFGQNKTKVALTPAYFDVTAIDVPIGAVIDEATTCTIYISNTGTTGGTQDVTIDWQKGGVSKYSHDVSKTISGEGSTNFTDEYTPLLGGVDWKIIVTTDDDSLESIAFTVNL